MEGGRIIGLLTTDNSNDDFNLLGVDRGPHCTMNMPNDEAVLPRSCLQTKHDDKDKYVYDDDNNMFKA